MLLVDAALRHVASKYLELLLVPAAADNLTTPGASTSITAGLSSQCWRERVDAPLSPRRRIRICTFEGKLERQRKWHLPLRPWGRRGPG